MKKILVYILVISFSCLFLTNFANSQSRFGELTEMRDKKMRGKDGQWVRPHPGPVSYTHLRAHET